MGAQGSTRRTLASKTTTAFFRASALLNAAARKKTIIRTGCFIRETLREAERLTPAILSASAAQMWATGPAKEMDTSKEFAEECATLSTLEMT